MDIAALQERCRVLEQELEEKDESMFELSATLATVQAEAQHEVKQVRKETRDEITKYQEALRRTEREATLLHHQLSNVTTAKNNNNNNNNNNAVVQQPPAAPVVPAATITTTDTTTQQQQQRPSLALVLLQSNIAKIPPPHVVVAAANTHSSDVAFIWQLTEHCLLHNTDWSWWKQALMQCATARSMIRTSCGTFGKKSRIVCQNTTPLELQQIATSLLESQCSGDNNTTSSSPYLQDLCQRLWHKLTCSTQYLDLVHVVLMDASPQECTALCWQPLCATLQSPIPILLLQYAKSKCCSSNGRRLEYTNDDDVVVVVDDSTLLLALFTLQSSWPSLDNTTTINDKDWARTIMAVLLDLLEFDILPNIQQQQQQLLACSILQVLQKWCMSQCGVVWMHTLFGIQEYWACTGMSVVVRLWNSIDNTTVAAECVRVLHLVLWHVRRQRERSESLFSQQEEDPHSFRSLLVEHAELHKAACNHMVVNKDIPTSLRQLAAMQLHELALDEEELEDVR